LIPILTYSLLSHFIVNGIDYQLTLGIHNINGEDKINQINSAKNFKGLMSEFKYKDRKSIHYEAFSYLLKILKQPTLINFKSKNSIACDNIFFLDENNIIFIQDKNQKNGLDITTFESTYKIFLPILESYVNTLKDANEKDLKFSFIFFINSDIVVENIQDFSEMTQEGVYRINLNQDTSCASDFYIDFINYLKNFKFFSFERCKLEILVITKYQVDRFFGKKKRRSFTKSF